MLNKAKLAAALSPPNSPLSRSTESPTHFSTLPLKENTHNSVFNLPTNPTLQQTTTTTTESSTPPSPSNNSRFLATLQWKSKSTLTHDVDLVAILLNKYGGIHDVCFYNNLDNVKGLKHSGDDRNGLKNLDSNRMKEQLKGENISREKAISDSNEYIDLDLSQVDQEVRCIIFLASCYAGTVLSELSFATCILYQYVNEQELKPAFCSKLDNQRDVSGQVFTIIQLRGGDAEVISTSVVPGKEKENVNKDEDDDEGSAMDNSSVSQSPGNSSHLKADQENDETTQEDEASASLNSSYYWQIVSKQVDIGHNERFIDSFMYAMCKDVLPENIFISMKNRLTYIIHLRQEEKKNLNKENMAIANLLKDDDHDDDEEYIVRVYSELTGSILIDQLIVEEVHKYLSTVQVSAEKPPFIPTLKDEALLQEINAKKEEKPSENDEDKKETEKPSIASQVSMQKSYTFNEDRVKIFIGWQALSGRSYSRYYLTTTVLFFGKYGARLGHIDQYTPKLSLARIENTTSTAGNSTSSIANDKPTVGNNSPRNATTQNNGLSTSSHAIKPTPAAVFYKDNLFESGKENDLCAEIDLSRLPKSVHSIIVIVTASSNAQDSGFQELKDPFVKISSPSVGDLYRYQLNTSDKAHQSFIACKLTCLRNPNESSGINFTSKKNQINSMVSSGSFIGLTKWKISNIGEYSYGVHPLIDPKLKAQIQSYVTTIDLPPCIELATQAEIEEEEREREAEKLLAEQDKASDSEKKEEKKENVEEVVSVGDDLDLIVVEDKPEEKKEKPRCFRISKQEVRTVGFDFSTVKNLDALQVLEFSQFGKLLTGGKPIMVNEENDLRKRKLALSKKNDPNSIQMTGSFIVKEEDEDEEHELPRQDQMLQSLSSFHRVDLNYSKEPHAPYFMCFLLKFKDISGNEDEEALDHSLIPEKQINSFRLWNVDEKVDMCIAKMRNVYNVDGSTDALEVFDCHQHATLGVIAYRGGQRDEWFIEVLDEIIEFQSPARKYLRSILQKCQFDISEPSNDIFRVPAKENTQVSKEFAKDNRDLVLGFGVVGNGGQKHILNAEVELYDHFGRYIGKVFDGYSDMDAKLKHRPINFLTIYTQDDEEQFDIRARDLVESSNVKYIVANVEVKSRSVLNENSQIYCRAVGMRTGQEIIRVQTAGSVFLDKYTKKEEKYEVNEDGYDSADESDNDIVVTMCVIELYKGGWKIVGCGEKNIVNLIPKYISPKPEGLKMEVSRGRNLLPVDHGSADPYLRVKLNEKNTRKGSKKQKVRTKIVNRTVNPDWHEPHTIHIFDYEDYLIVKCMDYQKTRDQYMGEFRVKIGDLLRLHNIGRERRFILRDAEYWKAKEGKLIGSKKDSALATPAMGEIYIKFSPCPASEVTIKK